ncbi:MAG: ankyrin repeat domain-containing protein [Gammaproteobacteria bacterium]|nr:ankyrin repeat domain-containing protein [Gammaproteobacteria bacterium]
MNVQITVSLAIQGLAESTEKGFLVVRAKDHEFFGHVSEGVLASVVSLEQTEPRVGLGGFQRRFTYLTLDADVFRRDFSIQYRRFRTEQRFCGFRTTEDMRIERAYQPVAVPENFYVTIEPDAIHQALSAFSNGQEIGQISISVRVDLSNKDNPACSSEVVPIGAVPVHQETVDNSFEAITRRLAASAPMRALTLERITALVNEAIDHGSVTAVEALHRIHFDFNADLSDEEAGVTMTYLVAQNGHADAIEKLAQCGADLNKARTDKGVTPAMIAAMNGHVNVIDKLHQYGADFEITVLDGRDVMHYAAGFDKVDVIRALHTYGVKSDRADLEGTRPIDLAKDLDNTEAIAELERIQRERMAVSTIEPAHEGHQPRF